MTNEELLKKMKDDMKMRNFSHYSFDTYSRKAKEMTEYFKKPMEDYPPIYTEEGWKSQTNRNGYEKPSIGDNVKTENGWKKLTKIEVYAGKENCYNFDIIAKNGNKISNYFANNILVEGLKY